jgi:hypothetical protein
MGTVSLARPPTHWYDTSMTVPPTRRIWHAEVQSLCDELESSGAWQAALRVRVAQGQALHRRPEGTAFDYRATVEDVRPLMLALERLRAGRGASRP